MQEKVVIITGASSGIGKYLAYEFAAKGAKVMLTARNGERLSKIVSDINSRGGDTTFCITDVGLESDCKMLIENTIKHFGKINILINNAGISMRALFSELKLDVLKEVMNINFWGAVYCTKYAIPHILDSKGSVVAVSSIAGIKGLPGRTGYSASKFALRGFMESLRIENLKAGLHVLIVYPGFTASNIRKTALAANGSQQGESPRNEKKMMSAQEVAENIYKAVKKRKNSIVLSSEGKLTVLINKFFPRMLDKIVFNHMAKEPDSPFK